MCILNASPTRRSSDLRSVRNLSLNHIKHQEVKKRYDKEWGDGETYSEIEIYDDAHLQQVRNAIKQAIDELPVQSRMTYSRSEEHTSELQSRGHLVCLL